MLRFVKQPSLERGLDQALLFVSVHDVMLLFSPFKASSEITLEPDGTTVFFPLVVMGLEFRFNIVIDFNYQGDILKSNFRFN